VKKIVLLGEILTEELLDSSDEWRGDVVQDRFHSTEETRLN
jgi:hypothetical protein